MSSVLEGFVREYVGMSESGTLPEEPELAKGYQSLYRIRSPAGRVPVPEAESELANKLNITKKSVRRRVLDKLNNRGYINVKVGIITLNVDIDPREATPAQKRELRETADDQLDTMADAEAVR